MTDESGILGNLPRSRPGRRSERRAGDAETERPAGPSRAGQKGGASRRASRPRAAGSTSSRSASGRRAGSAAPAAASARPPAGDQTGPAGGNRELATTDRDGTDILTGAARAAGDVATIGVRVAAKIAGGALRRLPKP